MQELLNQYLDDPEDPETNWNLAVAYYQQDQLSGALSFFLRCAERTYYENRELAYEALCHASNCYLIQGSRSTSVRGLLHQAIALDPNRPEAPWLLSTLLETNGQWDGSWIEAYQYATMAVNLEKSKFRLDVEYDQYKAVFQMAHCGWQIGRTDESAELFAYLYLDGDMDEKYETLTYNNLKAVGLDWDSHFETDGNFSEAHQDQFILKLCPDGESYIELGSGHAFHGNNTVLLEKAGWMGVSIDFNEQLTQEHKKYRRHDAHCCNAFDFDWSSMGATTKDRPVDYLQVDLEPAQISYEILEEVITSGVRANVITFEHDKYMFGPEWQNKARELLESKGFICVVNNVSIDGKNSFEDWYVHERIKDRIEAIWVSDKVKKGSEYVNLYK